MTEPVRVVLSEDDMVELLKAYLAIGYKTKLLDKIRQAEWASTFGRKVVFAFGPQEG